MAEVIHVPGAEPPVNDGERRAIEYLRHHLPEEFVLYPGIQVIHQDRADDIDILILTPHALVVGEIKDIAGSFVIDNGDFYVDGNRRPQPFITTNAKARRLKSRLQEHDPRLRDLWVSPLVILARKPAQMALAPPSLTDSVMLVEDAVTKLQDPSRVLPSPPYEQLGQLRDLVVSQLNLTRGRMRDVRFGPYLCSEQLRRTVDEDWWAAKHTITGREVEVRHVGRNPLTRSERVAEAHDETRAHETLSGEPLFDGPRDALPQDDGTLALIYDIRKGLTLDDAKAADEDVIDVDAVILDLVTAVAKAHDAGAVHGRLSPRWIEVLPESIRIRGFTLRETVAPTQLIESDEEFLAPEAVAKVPAGAPADLYGLGKLIAFLEPTRGELKALAERLADPEISKRKIPADYLRRAIGAALAPEENPTTDPAIEFDEEGHIPDGSIVGSHVIGELLGEGGFSQVYRARHRFGGAPRAIKFFGGEEAERFVAHEFRVLQEIEHPRIVEVFDAGEWEHGWFMVSEYLDGETLNQRIDEFDGQPEIGEGVLITHEILDALDTIHQQGITHRDVKPGNVILVEDRGAVLFDFGVAGTDESHVTGLTWEYWPPDLRIDAAGPDPDLFATGIILCELLTGEHPYPRRTPHAGVEPDVSKVPPGLRDIVAKAVSFEASTRFTSASEFRSALEPFVDREREIHITRRDLYRRVEQLISIGDLDEAEALCQPEWRRLLRNIERKRQAGQADGSVSFHGLRIQPVGAERTRVHRFDAGLGDAEVWLYSVTGKPGLMLDVRISEHDDGEVQVSTVDSYDSPERFTELVNRRRIGVWEEGDGYSMRLRYTTRPQEGRVGQRQTTVEELSKDAGVDIREVLIEAGATEVGRREDLGLFEPPRSKNEIAVLMPSNARNEVALRAYLLTTVIPLARDAGLLLQESYSSST